MTQPRTSRTSQPRIPYDADDEAALLGAALITHQAAVLVAHETGPEDFHVTLHGRVRDAIATLVAAGVPVDIATVASDISRRNGVKDIGSAKRAVGELIRRCPSATNAHAYHQAVREWTYRRRLLAAGGQLVEAAHHQDLEDLEAARRVITDLRDDTRRRFRRWTTTDLLECDRTFRWLARGLLCQPTYGMLGGPRKTLKTYLLLFIGLGVAAGTPIFGKFEVDEPGNVVYYVGEGGRIPMTRRLERVAEAIGYPLKDLPLFLHFETEPMNSVTFQETLRRDLEELRPAAVIIDPFYAFHGTEVKASDLHQEGALLSSVSTPCSEAGATLLLGNHFNKTGTGRGLDRITQAGGQEWSDTWILVSHRNDPDLDAGRFELLLDVGSRQWGGATWDLVLNIGRLDTDTGEFDGPITWEIGRHQPLGSGGEAVADTILDILADMPWAYTKTQVLEHSRAKSTIFRVAWDELKAAGHIVCERFNRHEEGRTMPRELWAPAGTPRPGEMTPGRDLGQVPPGIQLDLTETPDQEPF